MTGLPSKLALLAGLLAVFLLAAGNASPAVAHGSHPHPSTAMRQQTDLLTKTTEESPASTRNHVQAHKASKNAPAQTPEKSQDCCCGSLMCHAAVTLPIALVSLPYSRSERVVPGPSADPEQRTPSGLERPPRSLRSI